MDRQTEQPSSDGRRAPPRREKRPHRPGTRLRSRRWFQVGGVVVAVIVVLMALAPTVLSTTAGNRLLIAAANHRISGHLAADHISLGWLSGFTARGLTIADTAGRRVLDLPRVDTELTLLGALRSPPPLGKASVEVRSVDIVSYPDGTSSLSRIFGPGKGALQLPFTGDVQFSVAQASWRALGQGAVQARNGTGRIVIAADRLSADLKSLIEAPGLEASTLRAHAVADVDTSRALLVVREPSTIAEGQDNRLELAAGTRLSWGDEESDAKLTLRYDLRRLAALLAPALPGSLRMAGKHAATLHITGKLADGAGLGRLRKLTVAPTSFAYDRIEMRGLALHQGRLPVQLVRGVISFNEAELAANHGVVVLAGRIDLNGTEPRYLLDQPRVVARNVALNDELATGPLVFLPVSWGRQPKGAVSGTATVRLDQASVPLSKAGLRKEGRLSGQLNLVGLNADAPAIHAIVRALGPLAALAPKVAVRDQSMTVPFVLQDGRVQFEGVAVTAEPLQMSFSGTVGLDGTLMASSIVGVAGFSAPATVGITGTVQEPKVKLTSALGPGGLGKTLEEAPGLLEKLLGKGKEH